MDDFKDHPKSLTEHKADKAKDAGLWTPRDALIAALRDIDHGVINPTSIIIVGATKPEDQNLATTMEYYQAIPSTFYGIGMLVAAIKDYS